MNGIGKLSLPSLHLLLHGLCNSGMLLFWTLFDVFCGCGFYRSGAEAQVTNHPHSCHKLFGSQKAGERFIEEYKTTVLWKKETQGGDDIERLSDLMSRL